MPGSPSAEEGEEGGRRHRLPRRPVEKRNCCNLIQKASPFLCTSTNLVVNVSPLVLPYRHLKLVHEGAGGGGAVGSVGGRPACMTFGEK